jgi:hypothetical protein
MARASSPAREVRAGPIDAFAPAPSPGSLPSLTVFPPASQHGVFSARVGVPEIKNPTGLNPAGFLFWRRPTLARPFVALPSGLQRFTAVFGMGTGGATALLSPESEAGLAIRRFGGEAGRCRTLGTVIGDRWMVRGGFSFTIHLPLFTWKRTAASLMSTYRLSDSAVIDRRYSDNFV